MVLRASTRRRSRAAFPTATEPDGRNDTTEGMSRLPSGSGIVRATPSRTAATTVFVVPRSMPTATAILDKLHHRPDWGCDQDGSLFPRFLPGFRLASSQVDGLTRRTPW